MFHFERKAYLFAAKAGLFTILCWSFLVLMDHTLPGYAPRVFSYLPSVPKDFSRIHDSDGGVLFLGDSVNISVAADESDKRTLVDFLSEKVDVPVVNIGSPSFSIPRFKSQIEYLLRHSLRPQSVLIPLNLRSFSISWEARPAWRSTMYEHMYATPFQTRALAVLKWDFVGVTEESYNQRQVFVGGKPIGKMWELAWYPDATPSAVQARGRYLLYYATDIRESESLPELKRLLDLVHDSDLPVCFSLTPINVDDMQTHLSEEEMQIVDDNLDLLRTLLTERARCWIDLSHHIRAAYFDHPDHGPHEHLRAEGRESVAGEYAELLKRKDPVDYLANSPSKVSASS